MSVAIVHEHLKTNTKWKVGDIVYQNQIKNTSDYTLGAGMWAERHIGKRFSTIIGLNYTMAKVSSNIFTGPTSKPGTTNDFSEVHTYISINEKFRFYLLTKSKNRFLLMPALI